MNRLRLIFTCVVLACTVSCGGSLFKVKPAIDLPPMAPTSRSASAGGMTVVVAPLLSDEESQQLFEANLPLAGVLPVRVALNYESGVPLELKRARFTLRDAQGKTWKLISTKQAVSKIMKANGIFAYNPNSKKQFEIDFGAYGIDLKTPLSSTERTRHGFLFFATPSGEPVPGNSQLLLQVDGVPQPVELRLN